MNENNAGAPAAHAFLLKDAPVQRDPSLKDTDKSALYAIIQAAINVELFTIPLYMTSLYSIYGTHQITGNNDFYQGRRWPGMATKANPQTDNEKAFNAVFSVFIAEMLHLQLAANICKAVGSVPHFTSPSLVDSNFGWTCYSPTSTVLPHILDFNDTIPPYNNIRVNIGALNKEQVELFLAIEETEEAAARIIEPSKKKDKYFPTVPFANWQPSYDETNLPMFGSIGHMYLCLWEYISIKYSDGTTLWDYVTTPLEQDVFNSTSGGNKPEYPKMSTVTTDPAKVLDMISGITDQGEGSGVVAELKARMGMLNLQAVKDKYQPDKAAMESNYPSYSDTGKKLQQSNDADARSTWGSKDHFETFTAVMEMVETGKVKTWDQWHAEGNKWTKEMLETAGVENNKHPIPSAEDVAGALNRLKLNDKGDANYTQFSHTAAGAIAGVTRVLNDYWMNPQVGFPFPSMAGSGDRMSICWAIFGKAPDLSIGIKQKQPNTLYHSCQGLSLDGKSDAATCAAIEVYHTCRGSNDCKAEGGCGFVQSVKGGSGGCHAMATMATYKSKTEPIPAPPQNLKGGCGLPSFYSAPSDNRCKTFGGCAIPISASQMFPAPVKGPMELFDFTGDDNTPVGFDSMEYQAGELVYDVAWNAYCAVLKKRGQPVPTDKPKPSDLRLAFPPST